MAVSRWLYPSCASRLDRLLQTRYGPKILHSCVYNTEYHKNESYGIEWVLKNPFHKLSGIDLPLCLCCVDLIPVRMTVCFFPYGTIFTKGNYRIVALRVQRIGVSSYADLNDFGVHGFILPFVQGLSRPKRIVSKRNIVPDITSDTATKMHGL